VGETVAGIEAPDGDPGAVRDAAASLRKAAGGFQLVGNAVTRAGAAVGPWDGIASFMFRMTSGGIVVDADGGGEACDMAAVALDNFAERLADAKKDIVQMQKAGVELETQRDRALQLAAEAQDRLAGALAAMPAAALGAAGDGGAEMTRLQGQVEQAGTDALHYAGAAGAAEDALERLRGKARDRLEALERDGDAAAGRVRAAYGRLPEVLGSRTGSVGGIPLTSHTERTSVALTVVVIRIGANEAVVKEHLANGSWRVTRVKGLEGGFEFDPVPGFAVDATGKGGIPADSKGAKAGRLGASPDIQAAYLAQHEEGEVFTFRSEADADRFIRYRDMDTELAYGPPVGAPLAMQMYRDSLTDADREAIEWADRQEPVETYEQSGTKASASASFGGVGGASGSAMEGLGTRIDTETGAQTRYSKLSGEVAADFAPPGAQVSGKLNGEAIVGITRTPDGDVTGMTINLSGTAQSAGGLGTEVPIKDLAGKSSLSGHELAGTRVERVIHIDAADPGNREAIERFQDSGGNDPLAVIEIASRLDDEARVDIRHFDYGGSDVGGGIDTKIVKVEGSYEEIDSELASAVHRTPGGDAWVSTHRDG
jgi:hypothetical protein